MNDKEIEDLIKRSYDLHFHVGPDILPRKYTVEQLLEEEEGKIKGVALKAHSFPTILSINSAQINHGKTEIDLIGSVTLNYFMGGFNPSAVYASATLSKEHPIIVWLPTVHAENHLLHNKSNYEIPPEWIGDPSFKPRTKDDLKAIKCTNWNGKLIRKAEYVLDMMAKHDCIMGTGHVSWQEAKTMTEEALNRGIRVILTHPMQRDIAMPVEVQAELADKGAVSEYCYIMYLDRDNPGDYPLETQVDAIKEIGVEKCILSSDGGQVRNPGPSDCLKEYVKLLGENGLKKQDFEKMLVDTPKKLITKK
ncbi:MAG TPA: hypothetical protein ENN13_04160 [Candidatus Altiarchaeales archaeon]|nr:hypothetical protein [Candidatus Altiarchaeales archaeon]